MTKTTKVLLIAEACNPQWVSVPLVGWSMCQAIAKRVDAHVVTQIRNRNAILEAGLVEGRDFTAIDSEPIARRVHAISHVLTRGGKGGWTTGTALNAISYPYFEHLVWQRFGRRIRSGEFDVVHRVTPLSPTIPSLLASRCKEAGVPFVLGPLNGGVPWPREFDRERRKEHEWLSYVRDAYKLLPGYRATRANATAILIASRDTWKQMPRAYHSKCFYIPENAIDPARFAARRTRFASRPIRAIFIGRLVPYKGADMLLEAAEPLLRSGAMTLEIVGDGPQMTELRAWIEQRQLNDKAKLVGWVEHARVQDRLVDSDVMTFPSIREFGGGVALEAMAVGVVPVVMDYGGLGELVTRRTGVLIPMGSRAQVIERLRAALSDLAKHPETIEAMAPAAIRRAHEQFTWDAKAAQVEAVYEWVLGRRRERPTFAMPMPDPEQQRDDASTAAIHREVRNLNGVAAGLDGLGG